MMRISDAGLALLKQLEGWSETVYPDSSGLPTIGFGHLVSKTELGIPLNTIVDDWMKCAKHKFSNGLTLDQGTELLKADLEHFEAGVFRLVKTELKQCQFDALVCFTFNVGLINFLSSNMLKRLNAGDTAIGPDFEKWCKARNKDTHQLEPVPGLLNRRKAERALYERN